MGKWGGGGGEGRGGGWREGKGKGVFGEVRCGRRWEEVMLILVGYRELMGIHSVFSLLSPSSLSGFLFRRTSRSSHRRLIFASFSSIDLT